LRVVLGKSFLGGGGFGDDVSDCFAFGGLVASDLVIQVLDMNGKEEVMLKKTPNAMILI
jgi:hypothetical protein